MFQVQDEIHIHAAREAVWTKFARLHEWPRWNSEILDTEWLQGEPWAEGSRFALRHRSLLGVTTTTAVLRMVSPGRTAVWESHAMGMTIVNSANFADDLGGCKLTARHAYHGAGSLVLRLFRTRQQTTLEQAMRELKSYIEGEPRR
jgi:hypothetical protein